jgi:molybdopterin-guanine dinucleotide biosynthesis protein B
VKLLGIGGWSGSGKTTLIEHLIPVLAGRGVRVSTIKHAHHEVDLDTPGKDSWRHRQAGAAEVLVATGRRWALLHELRDEAEPTLSELVRHIGPCDLVLVEGFKREPIPRIEVWRARTGKPPLYVDDRGVLAVVTDTPLPDMPVTFGLADYNALAGFIMTALQLRQA